MKKYLTRHVQNDKYVENILDIPNLKYSKISFKQLNKVGNSNEVMRLKERLIDIFSSDQYTNKQKYEFMLNLINSPQYTYEEFQMVYNSLDNRIREFIRKFQFVDQSPNYTAPAKPRINNPAFSFDKEDEGKEKNIVFLNNNIINDSSGNSCRISSLTKDFNEDVDKPPVFETHVASNLNQCPIKASGHAFIGFRFTQYENGRYKRKCFKIGYGVKKKKSEMIKANLLLPVPNRLMNDMFWGSAISTQTEISVNQSKRLLDNIKLYFKRYPLFNIIGRNCNVFTRTMAREIGLSNIASLHNTIIPAAAANRISKELSKGNNLDNFRADFSVFRYISNQGKKNLQIRKFMEYLAILWEGLGLKADTI